MAYHESLSSTFTGRVVSVNDKGLKLEGHDVWMNVSKFGVPVTLPQRHDTVTVSVDSKGFLRACEVLDAAQAASAANGALGGDNLLRPATFGSAASDPSVKDRTITRLAVLKAAAEYAASKPESKSADVLKIAECWERWVIREPDELTHDVF